MNEQGRASGSAGDTRSQASLTPAAVEQLLQVGLKAARAGKQPAARAVLYALARQQPGELRAWWYLADVAASDAEAHHALEQVLALDPSHAEARTRLQQLHERMGPVSGVARPEPQVSPEQELVPGRRPWLVVSLGGLVVLVLAVWALSQVLGQYGSAASGGQPTATLPGQSSAVPAPPAVGFAVATATAVPPREPAPARGTGAPAHAGDSAETPLPASPTAPPPLTPVALGSILEYDGWQATLVRPDYAQVLDTPVGGFAPSGRFVLTLLLVANQADVARSIPPDLFLLTDAQGRSYRADPQLSQVYLEVYGPTRGDLVPGAEWPPGGALYSVPLLFDVPADATGLVLTMGKRVDQGWPVSGGTILDPDAAPPVTPNAGP